MNIKLSCDVTSCWLTSSHRRLQVNATSLEWHACYQCYLQRLVISH